MSEYDSIDIDTILWHAGDFGRYQFLLMFLFSVINLISGFHYFGQTFITIVPEHQCHQASNFQVLATNQCSLTVFKNDSFNQEIPCTKGWSYNNSYGYISIVQEMNWVCDDAWKPAIGQSLFFIGSVLGSLILGVLADQIGRLHVLIIANMFAFFGNLSTILSTNVAIFAASRFLAGCATDANFMMMYIIVMEYIRPSARTMALNICIGVFYCISNMAVPWVAVGLGNWKMFLLVISVPHLVVLSFYLLVPESAQWLISKGRIEEAIQCFRRIAKINRRVIDEKAIDSLRRYCAENVRTSKSHETFLSLLKTPKLRRKTLILIFKSMVLTLGYDAISRNVNGLGYSPFVIFSATSSTILPACLFILAVQDRIGRKALASSALLLAALLSLASGGAQAPAAPPAALVVALAVAARLAITVAYNSGTQYAVELIPTVVRGQGVSVIHVTGYAASFFSPHVLYLAAVWRPAPEVVLGALLALGAVACLFLPETLGRLLPVTLEDGERFGEDEAAFEFACCGGNTSESTMELSINTYPKYSF